MVIQSVDRALDLLESIASYGDWVGVRELSRLTGLKTSTAQNLLKTLCARGYLEFDENTRRYRVGIQTYLVSESIDPLGRLTSLASETIREVMEELGETSTICTIISGRVVIVDACNSTRDLVVMRKRQIVDHPHRLASGMVLIAYQSEEYQNAYVNNHELPKLKNLTTDPRALLKEFRKVREQGFAERVDVDGQRIAAIAVPVFGLTDTIEMTLAVSGPIERMNGKRMKKARIYLTEKARLIENRLRGE